MILVSFETVNSLCISAVSSSGKSLLFVIAIRFFSYYAAKVQRFFEISKKIEEKKYKIQNTKLQKKGNGIRIVMGGRRRCLIDRLLYYYNNIIIYI